jgi:hypothetical protein
MADMETARESVTEAELKYFVLGNGTGPLLLARLRWPDVAQAITAGLRDWQDDIGLFDLPYDPNGQPATFDEATAIAAGWGVVLPADGVFSSPLQPLIRRMPANWSNLAPAEKHAWALEFVTSGRRSGSRRQMSKSRAASGSQRSRFGLRRSTTKAERRLNTRVLVGGQTKIRLGRKIVSADLVDLSQGGMHCVVLGTQAFVEVGGKLGPPLVLEVHSPKSRITLEVGGTVTWHNNTGLGTHFGIEFAPLNDEQLERVRRLLVTSGAEGSS